MRYTICSYFPDFYRVDKVYHFAVLVASETEIALVGVNLAAFGLTDDSPFSQAVIEKTYEIMMRRLTEASNCLAADSGFKVLDRVVTENQSNIQFQPVKTLNAEGNAIAAAFGVFAQEIENKLPSRPKSDATVPRAVRRSYPQKPETTNVPQLV